MNTAMDTDDDVRKLVEVIFGMKPTTIPEEGIAHSSSPSEILTEDFSKRLINVQDFRQCRNLDKVKGYFDGHYRNMLSSHMAYVSHVMGACMCENIRKANVFDSFIRLCVIIWYFSEETLSKVGVDFRELNPDIFMVFYRKALKSPFRKREDFNRLVEYICDKKHLNWTCDSTAYASKERRLKNIMKELKSSETSEKESHNTAKAMLVTGTSLVREVLSNRSVKLPDLPSEYELIRRLVEYRKREKENEAERKRKVEATLTVETSHGEANFNSDSKTDFGEQEENIAWYESIIQAVIRYNHSIDSGKEIANNQIHEEATGILENLESNIKPLIEVLDNCCEE